MINQELPQMPAQRYPANCLSCGLYQSSSFYKANTYADYSTAKPEVKPMLVVDHLTDSLEGISQTPTNEFIHSALKMSSVPYLYTSALRCEINYGLKGKELANCYHQCRGWLWAEIYTLLTSETRLGCIVCLGKTAMDAIIPESQLTVAAASKGIQTLHYQMPNGTIVDIPVLVTNQPEVHFRQEGGRDLRNEYIDVFGLANRICTGQYKKPEFNFQVIMLSGDVASDQERVARWMDRNREYAQATRVIYDIEQSIDETDPNKMTCLHPGAKIICFTLTWTHPDGNPRVVVFRTRYNKRSEIFALVNLLLFGIGQPKQVVGSNLLFDLLVTCCHASDEEYYGTGYYWDNIEYQAFIFWKKVMDTGFDDSFGWSFFRDMGTVGNGLKKLYTKIYREPDYSIELDNHLKLNNIKDYGKADIDLMEKYNGMDGYAQWMVDQYLLAEYNNPDHPCQIPYAFFKQEMFAAAMLSICGIPVDVEYFKSQDAYLTELNKALGEWVDAHPMTAWTGKTHANAKSPQQMSKLIELTLNYYPELEEDLNKTPSGLYQCNGETLTLLQEKCPGPVGDFWKALADNRGNRDLQSKFLSMPLQYAMDHGDGKFRIHPMMRIAKSDFRTGNSSVSIGGTEGVDSGRWSNEPNTMNIPSRIDPVKVKLIRTGYIPVADDYYYVNGDLKTIEPVVNAWISDCKKAKAIFMRGCADPNDPEGDWYRGVGCTFFDVAASAITKAQRNIIKGDVLLALSYGQHPMVLCDILGCDYETALAKVRKFFYQDFPELHCRNEANRYNVFYGLPITTVTGHRQFFPLSQHYDYNRETDFWLLPHELSKKLDITPSDQHVLRKSGNFEIQGAAAKLNARGLININKRRMVDPEYRAAVIPHNSVHDALVFSIVKHNFQHWLNETATLMYSLRGMQELGWRFGFTDIENPLRGEFTRGMNYASKEDVEYQIVER